MGSKYTTQTASGFNSSPPPDDGSQNASNLITWSGIKAKLADPTKNLVDAINTALVSAFDYSVRQITTSDTVLASDHMKTVEISPTATSGVTVTLSDAATMTNNFRVFVKNSSAFQQAIARATGGDTIEGSAANITIPPKSGFIFQTTTGADGYVIIGGYPLEITNLTEDTAPAVSDLVPTYDVSATALKKATLEHLISGAAASQSDQETATATNRIVTPGRQKYHPSAAKAWALVTLSGGTPSLTANYNCSSVTDNGVGDFTINFTTAFSSTSFGVMGICNEDANSIVRVRTKATGSVQIGVSVASTGAQSDNSFFIACFGDQ